MLPILRHAVFNRSLHSAGRVEMNQYWILVTILFPILAGAFSLFIPFPKRTHRILYLETVVVLTSMLVYALFLHRPAEVFAVVRFTGNLTISFYIDGMTMIFGGLVAALWPFATLYSFEYMKREEHEKIFFAFYTITYGVTLGISMASDFLTMYFFYELLTLVTVPLVLHTLTRQAILAARKYLYYSLGGAAFGFIGLIFMLTYGMNYNFTLGGMIHMDVIGDKTNIFLLVYVLAFFGFGVKAALCPFHSWLPDASVAPMPVTALLHAVAVVKSGAFAIIRITYYCFGTEFLIGTWAQKVVMAAVIVTIVYGCSRAVKETHLKRRLAYSTISNMSYILFGVALMSPAGLVGAASHMIFHGIIKICAFFCVGAVTYQTEKSYVHEIDGFGRRMPIVFGIFTVSAFALMGVPGLAGFISKWNLASAAVSSHNTMAYFGIGALLISSLLTAVYMLTIVVRAFFPEKEFASEQTAQDPNWYMILPLAAFCAAMVYFGLFSTPIIDFITDVANGMY